MANDGNLSCTQLKEIDVTLQSKWPENGYEASKAVIKADTLNAIMSEQTATFEEVESRTEKVRTVQVNWLESCRIATEACNISCDDPTTGVEFGDNCLDVDVTGCTKAVNLKISEQKLSTSSVDFDEMVANALYQADRAIAENLNVLSIGVLDAAVNANQNPNTWGGYVTPAPTDGTCTTMHPSIWTDPQNYFVETETLNNYSDPYYIGGGIYSKYLYNKAREQGQSFSGEGEITVDGRRNYIDLRALDQTVGSQKLYMVNRGEFAYVNAYYYPTIENRIEFAPNKWAYRIQSPILSGLLGRPVWHDVVYTVVCAADGNVLRRDHYWQIINHYEFVQSPADCDDNNRVLCFTCG